MKWALWVIAVSLAVLVTTNVARVYRLADLTNTEIELRHLRDRMDSMVQDDAQKNKDLRAELDGIQRTLYSEPAAPTRRPTALETWQRNSLEDLRKRVTQLEMWRYRQDR